MQPRWGPKRYTTVEDAKRGCFDALEFLAEKHLEAVRLRKPR
jgi:hypothetical protein